MRITVQIVGTTLLALLASGCASSAGTATTGASTQTDPVELSAPLPKAVQERGTLRVGVKCDYPPFGYTDASGEHAGYDIEISKKMAEYAFGDPNAVEMTCSTITNRVPNLLTNQIDVIVATLGYTAERAKTIQYSTPYFKDSTALLVKAGQSVSLDGLKTVILIRGSQSSTWFTKCHPNIQQLPFDTASQALSALDQGRASAYSEGVSLLVPLTAKRGDDFSITDDRFVTAPWGMATRLEDDAMTAWVDAAIERMTEEDFFAEAVTQVVENKAVQEQVKELVPRPDTKISYPTGDVFEC